MRNRARRHRALAAALIMACTPAAPLLAQCGFRQAFTRPDERGTQTVTVFEGDPVPALGNARPLLFITSLKVNTDGTKISYHQDDPTGRRCRQNPASAPCAINNIRNAYRNPARPESEFTALRDAGYPLPRTWQVLSDNIIEKNRTTGKPCITPDGYLVSMTADVAVNGGFTRVGDCDPAKWIDALAVPAIVVPKSAPALPSQFVQKGVGKRSLVIALSRSATRRIVSGIVGDLGPASEIGEATVAMNRALNGLPETEQPKHRQDAIDRFQAGRTAVVVFPGTQSVMARPLTAPRVAQAGDDALTKFGGVDQLYRCIQQEVDPMF